MNLGTLQTALSDGVQPHPEQATGMGTSFYKEFKLSLMSFNVIAAHRACTATADSDVMQDPQISNGHSQCLLLVL